MRRGEITLTLEQRKLLGELSRIPTTFQERLEDVKTSAETENIFISEEELEKILDILPPPSAENRKYIPLRSLITQRLQTL